MTDSLPEVFERVCKKVTHVRPTFDFGTVQLYAPRIWSGWQLNERPMTEEIAASMIEARCWRILPYHGWHSYNDQFVVDNLADGVEVSTASTLVMALLLAVEAQS